MLSYWNAFIKYKLNNVGFYYAACDVSYLMQERQQRITNQRSSRSIACIIDNDCTHTFNTTPSATSNNK